MTTPAIPTNSSKFASITMGDQPQIVKDDDEQARRIAFANLAFDVARAVDAYLRRKHQATSLQATTNAKVNATTFSKPVDTASKTSIAPGCE
jgi:hypothetical protein